MPNIESNQFEIRKLINEITAPFETDFKYKGLKLKTHIDNKIPKSIYSDQKRIK